MSGFVEWIYLVCECNTYGSVSFIFVAFCFCVLLLLLLVVLLAVLEFEDSIVAWLPATVLVSLHWGPKKD